MTPQAAEAARRVAGKVMRRIGRQAEREDIEQVALIAAWRAEESWNHTTPLTAWVSIKARGAIMDHLRKWNSSRNQSKPTFCELPEMATPPETIRCPRLESEIQKLSPRSQYVLRELIWYGSTAVELAPVLGVSPSRVVAIQKATIKTLRQQLLPKQ